MVTILSLDKQKVEDFQNMKEDSLAYRWWPLEDRPSGPKFKVDKE
jgi:hypothetical protein